MGNRGRLGGDSDAIAEVGELTEVTLAFYGGRLTAMAGSTLLVSIDRRWLGQMSGVLLSALSLVSTSGNRGFFDWVELSTLAAEADADWHEGPLDLDIPELAQAWPGVELPSVEIRKE